MIPDCTLTTACFDLSKYHKNARPLIDNINNMRTLLETPCYLVIYTDETCINHIKEIRNSYNLQDLTHYIIISFEELHFYKYNDVIKQNRAIYWATKDERTCSESHLICCSKFQFVLETIENNYFGTSKFGWIDANLSQNFSKICEDYKPGDLINVLNRIIDDKFHIQILNVNDKKYKADENLKEFYQRYRWIVCGCLFLTNEKVGVKILQRLNQIFEETTNKGYGHAEEMLYFKVLDEYYDDIEKSYGDYGQIINNFIYPTRNFHYIHNHIIQGYLNIGYNKECYDCCKKILYSIEIDNMHCEPSIYLSILFSYYVSSYYHNPQKSRKIVEHIYFVCKNNPAMNEEYNKNKALYESNFNWITNIVEPVLLY